MPTIYFHEIQSYRVELSHLQGRSKQVIHGEYDNLTHASLALSNRQNLIVIGLCSLVEVWLFSLVEKHQTSFRLSDIKGQGIERLKTYLSRVGAVCFGDLQYWDEFSCVYKIRNEIVHSYGGMATENLTDTLATAINKLGFKDVLVGGYRIRLSLDHTYKIIGIVDELLNELGAYKT